MIFASMKFPFVTESHTDRCIAMGGENVVGCSVDMGGSDKIPLPTIGVSGRVTQGLKY